MTTFKTFLALAAIALAAGCTNEGGDRGDKTVDAGARGVGPLQDLQAGIWVDPNGCDHWIIDDGVEGYLSQRLDRSGRPVCSGIAPPNTATGNYKRGQDIRDRF
ncbi:hypothetical protein AADZ90_018960 [Aestuariibius sp. 2305UL40-4]|uniref:hypothetical protein n=1 Tax=Aestuariibius violaceus TaxID=3234132 RepID=UPI00345E1457